MREIFKDAPCSVARGSSLTRLRADSSAPGLPCEQSVQLVREGPAVARAPGRRSTGLEAARTKLGDEVAHGEALRDVLRRVEDAAGVERVTSARNHLGGERDVGRHDQVPGPYLLHDLTIRAVEAARDPHAADEGRRRGSEQRVSYQDQVDLHALGSAEEDFLDRPWARVGVHPDLHRDFEPYHHPSSGVLSASRPPPGRVGPTSAGVRIWRHDEPGTSWYRR